MKSIALAIIFVTQSLYFLSKIERNHYLLIRDWEPNKEKVYPKKDLLFCTSKPRYFALKSLVYNSDNKFLKIVTDGNPLAHVRNEYQTVIRLSDKFEKNERNRIVKDLRKNGFQNNKKNRDVFVKKSINSNDQQ